MIDFVIYWAYMTGAENNSLRYVTESTAVEDRLR